MSLIRMGQEGSSVYITTTDAGLNCCICSLGPDDFIASDDIPCTDMIGHLEQHQAAGDHVPGWVFDILKGVESDEVVARTSGEYLAYLYRTQPRVKAKVAQPQGGAE